MKFIDRLRNWGKKETPLEIPKKEISVSNAEIFPVSQHETKTKSVSLNEIETSIEDAKNSLLTELKGLFLLLKSHDTRIVNLITELAVTRHITPKQTRMDITKAIREGQNAGKSNKEIVETLVSRGLCSRATGYRILKSVSSIEIETKPVSINENETAQN